MSIQDETQQINFTPDRTNLYREESITDLKVASIRRLIPIKADGSVDNARSEVFLGHTQLMSPEGPVPLQASLKATTFEEALSEFPAAMQVALEDMVTKLQAMRQKQEQQQDDSRIIVPGR